MSAPLRQYEREAIRTSPSGAWAFAIRLHCRRLQFLAGLVYVAGRFGSVSDDSAGLVSQQSTVGPAFSTYPLRES